MPDPQFLRHWSLDPDVHYLNHGSFGATPREILSLQAVLRSEMEREPVQFLWRHLPKRLEEARHALAGFLQAKAADVAFVPNATSAVNAVLRSRNWQMGDEILITDHTYNACRNVINHVATQHDLALRVTTIPFPTTDADQVLDSLKSALTTKTRFALIDHVTSPTALVFPIKEIVDELHTKDIDVFVDGAHGPGMLALDLNELGADYYTGNLHKWVCAPKGAAFLHAREEHQHALMPPVISHGLNNPREGSTTYQDLFDWPGTFDPTAWLCVPAALEFMQNLLPGGWDGLRLKQKQLLLEARALFLEAFHLSPPCPDSMLGSMATLPLPISGRSGKTLQDLQNRLFDLYRIEVPMSEHGGRVWLRLSAQIYNSPDDYEALVNALRKET